MFQISTCNLENRHDLIFCAFRAIYLQRLLLIYTFLSWRPDRCKKLTDKWFHKSWILRNKFWNVLWSSLVVFCENSSLYWYVCTRCLISSQGCCVPPKDDSPRGVSPIVQTKNSGLSSSSFPIYSLFRLLPIGNFLHSKFFIQSHFTEKKKLKEIVHHGKQREDGDPSFFQLSFRHCSAQCQHSYLLTEVTDSSNPLYLGFYFRCFLFPASIVLMSQAILNCY